MLLWASESWSTRSPGPTRWPMTDSFVEWPPTKVTAASVPRNFAMADSNSP